MSSQDWVNAKLREWQSACERGDTFSIDDACNDASVPPEWRDELRQAIERQVATAIPQPDDGPPPVFPAAGAEWPAHIGRFRIEGVLGQGAYGVVLRAVDDELQRTVAIKVPRRDRQLRSGDVSEYLNEARNLAALDHPHIVTVHEAGRSDEAPCYVVSKFINGGNLEQRLRSGRLSFVAAGELVASIADALHYAHLKGIYHRDVKPSNILIDEGGRPYLADFGLALSDDGWGAGPGLVGTLAYMSPEQAAGKGHRVDGRSDIYSLGAVLYELLCGRPPLLAAGQLEQLELIQTQEPKPPRQIDDRIPVCLEDICLKALRKRPGDRYTTAKDFAEELRQCCARIPEERRTADGSSPSWRAAGPARLPLPLAQLARRAQNAKSPNDRHRAAVAYFEATVKLLGAVAVATYAAVDRRDATIAPLLQRLARPTLRHWWILLRRLTSTLAAEGDLGFRDIDMRLGGRCGDDQSQAARLVESIGKTLSGDGHVETPIRIPKLSDVFEQVQRYLDQSAIRDASAARPATDPDSIGRALLAALNEILGQLDPLAGRRLLYVDEIKRDAQGGCAVEALDLSGREEERLPTAHFADERSAPRPQRLYVTSGDTAGGFPTSSVELHPLVTYDAELEETFFLSARRGRRDPEYLCYTSGRTIRSELVSDRGEFLARVLRTGVTEQDVVRWAGDSQAEEGPVEAGAVGENAPLKVGEFELISLLGKGGMGVVYRARQPSMDRQVALKCLLRAGDAKSEARFAREIRALGRVEHPHLVRVYTSGVAGNQWYHAMELIDGIDLSEVAERLARFNADSVDEPQWHEAVSTAYEDSRTREEPVGSDAEHPAPPPAVELPEAQPATAVPPKVRITGARYLRRVVELMRQVATATQALHSHNVLHRDIKPGNIRLQPDGQTAVLMDLGLAKLLDDSEGALTRSRQFVGTLRYASPEQVAATGPLDVRTDVYSLGATLWELLTLRPLFDATNAVPPSELMRRIQFDEPGLPSRHNRAVPHELDAIVEKCLRKNARERYASAAELADDLHSWLIGDKTSLTPLTVAYRARKYWYKWRQVIKATTAIILLQAVLIWLLVIGLTTQQQSPTGSPAISSKSISAPPKYGELERDTVAIALRALETTHASVGPSDPEYVNALVRLAREYIKKEEFDQAEFRLREAIMFGETVFGDGSVKHLESLELLAQVFAAKGDIENAERVFREAVRIQQHRADRGVRDPTLATALVKLASFVEEQSRIDEAEALYQQALNVAHEIVGSEHRMYVEIQASLTSLQEKRRLRETTKAVVSRGRAVLVGCTRYPNLAEEYQLEGPANDVELMRRLLVERFGFAADRIVSLTETAGPDRLPTRANIRAALGDLARSSQQGDVCLVFLAGHGSTQPDTTGDEAWDPEPDGLDEVFLPRDTGFWRDNGIADALVDDELELMLSAILARGAEVFLISDSCYAGNSRAAGDAVRTRCVPPAYLGVPSSAAVAAAPPPAPESADPAEIEFHGLVSLFYRTQTIDLAVEDRPMADRPAYGRLTLGLYQILQQSREPLTYRQLASRLLDMHTERRWHLWGLPSWYYVGEELDGYVLGHDQPAPQRALTVRRLDETWTVNRGRLDGLYPGGILAARTLDAAEQAFTVVSAGPFSAVATPVIDEDAANGPSLPDQAACRVLYAGVDDALMEVRVATANYASEAEEQEARSRLESVVREFETDERAAVRLVKPGELPEWLAITSPDGIRLHAAGSPLAIEDPRALLEGHALGVFAHDQAHVLSERLKRIRAATRFVAFAGRDRADTSADVRLQLSVLKNGETFSPVDESSASVHDDDRMRLEIRNTGSVDLQVIVVYVDSNSGISQHFPVSRQQVDNNQIPPGHLLSSDIEFKIDTSTLGWEHVIVLALPADDRARFNELLELLESAVVQGIESLRGISPLVEAEDDTEFDPARRLILDSVGCQSPMVRPQDLIGQQRFAIGRVSWNVLPDDSDM